MEGYNAFIKTKKSTKGANALPLGSLGEGGVKGPNCLTGRPIAGRYRIDEKTHSVAKCVFLCICNAPHVERARRAFVFCLAYLSYIVAL